MTKVCVSLSTAPQRLRCSTMCSLRMERILSAIKSHARYISPRHLLFSRVETFISNRLSRYRRFRLQPVPSTPENSHLRPLCPHYCDSSIPIALAVRYTSPIKANVAKDGTEIYEDGVQETDSLMQETERRSYPPLKCLLTERTKRTVGQSACRPRVKEA